MPSEPKQDLLEEAIAPYLATEEGQRFLQGQANIDEIRSCLVLANPPAAEHFSNLLLRYMWEEISTADLQTELQVLFASNECLQTPPARLLEKISPFLTASVKSDAEQASAKHAICDLFGLVTQKCDRGRSSLEQGMQFQHDVEERFKTQPGKYEEFLRAGFGSWRDGNDPREVRARLREILEGNEDLIQRFEAI